MKLLLGPLVLVAFLLSACGPEAPTTGPLQQTPGTTSPTFARPSAPDVDLTNRYIVVFKPDVMNPDVVTDQISRASGGEVHFRYSHALKGFAATIPAAAVDGIRHNPNVEFVEEDGIATISGTQTSPPSWGLDRIDQRNLPLDNVYNYPNDGYDVTVYIIDTGIRGDHQEFTGRVAAGRDFVDNDYDATDCHGHGTHVAGTVGGTTVGVAKRVTLVGVRVLNCAGSGTISGVIAGVDWVTSVHSGPSVANMSLGGGYSSSLNLAVNNSVASGVVYAVAAGNDGLNACNYSPASAASALTVGATGSTDAMASFSNYGTCVDIFAPGVNITSSTRTGTNTYATWSGTSMASPHVAGVAALYLYDNPTATPSQVATAIINDAATNVLSSIGTGSPNRLLHNFWASSSEPTAPAAPSNLNAAASSISAIDLTWSDNSGNEDGFTIERATSSGGPFAWLADVGANTTSYSNTALDEGTTYWYRVKATNSIGSSAWSNTDNATTLLRVHVSGLSGSSASQRGGWKGTLTVTVQNTSGLPQAGVTVAVSWSNGSGSGVTNSNGQCSVTTGKFKSNVPSVTMTVTNLSGTGFAYDSGSNSPDLSNPPSLVVNKP